ncbi:MAG: PDZ domain-containing protein [Roseiarcus sp.]
MKGIPYWAEWLIEALERYRAPKGLQDRGLPPRLRKIFRDEDEVPASSDLNDQIREALVASRYLIVVCSAFTPRSKWVEREIQVFNELGRSDQILALLTEGEPGDAFPEAMLTRHREVVDPDGGKRIVKTDKEPLAADVRPRRGVSNETLKHMALLRLVSVILGVKFDDLRQRERERQRKRRLTWAAVAAAVVVLIGGVGGFAWDTMRPKTAYYRQLTWRWGLPEGVGEIDAKTHDLLGLSYSVVTQRGKVVEARRDSWFRAEPDGQARWVVDYGDDGGAQKIDIYGPTGRLLRENVLKREASGAKMIVGFERNDVPLAQEATQNLIADETDTTPAPTQAKSEITRQELMFDDAGLAVEVRYQDNWGTPQHDAQGSFGERFSYSPEGFVLRSAEIGPNGEEITLKSGVHAVASTYDAENRLVRVTLLGEDGRPIVGPAGYASFVREYEAWGNGNATAQTYYDADGRPTTGRNGYSKLVGRYDEHGDNTELAFYDVDGKPTPHKDGYAVIKRKFDDRRNVIEEALFDVNGRPTFDNLGRASYRRTYDERGDVIEWDYFGVDGRPAISKEGFAKMRRSFDAHANIVEEAYFDADGKPTLSTFGHAGFRQQFNERDEKTETAYFGPDGKPTLSKEAIAEIKIRYDARGNEIESAYFGVDGKPTLFMGGASGSGYASVRQAFDERGNRVEGSYFGIQGEPVLARPLLAARITIAYDAHGNVTEIDFFGVDGKPTPAPGGAAIVRQAYDARGDGVETILLGVDGKPKASPEGVARTTHSFDSRGRETGRAFFGADGKPTLGRAGNAEFRQAYDERGDVIETSYFGLDGKPTLHALGYASLRQAFDDRRNRIDLSYFGVDGKPTPSKEAIAEIKYAYDARGNEVERGFFGLDGKPALVTGGFAGYRQAFDAHNNLAAKTFFAVDGEPTRIRDGGYAKIAWDYDARGDLISESYFGADGAPAPVDGCVRVEYAYDNLGRQTKVTYLDAENRELQMELVVRNVVPGWVGAQAGLAPGDRILTYNGVKVTSVKQLDGLTGGTSIFAALTVRRGSEVLTLNVSGGSLGAYLGLARVDAQAGAGASPVAPPAPQSP